MVIFADGYQVISTYDNATGNFLGTNGGTWKLEGNTMTEIVEFNSMNPETVGMESVFKVQITDNEMQIVGSDMQLKRLDNGTPGNLQGAWLMSGRVRNGNTEARDTSRPRKTMKILSVLVFSGSLTIQKLSSSVAPVAELTRLSMVNTLRILSSSLKTMPKLD